MTSCGNVIYLPPSPEYPSLVADVRADGKILFAIAAPEGEDPQKFAAQLAKDEETIKLGLLTQRYVMRHRIGYFPLAFAFLALRAA